MKDQKIPKLYYTNEHQTFLAKAQPGDINTAYVNAFHMLTLAIKNNILPAHWHYIHTCGVKGITHLINPRVTPAPLINLSITNAVFDDPRATIIDLVDVLQAIREENRKGIDSPSHTDFSSASIDYEAACQEVYDIAKALLVMTDYYKESGEIL